VPEPVDAAEPVETATEIVDLEPGPCGDARPVEPYFADAVDDAFPHGPYLQNTTSTGTVVVFTDGPDAVSQGCVTIGPDTAWPGEQRTVCSPPLPPDGRHEVAIDGLLPDTPYRYAAMTSDRDSPPESFRTAPAASRPVRMLIFADAHANPVTMPQIGVVGLADDVDMAIEVGDLVNDCSAGQYDIAFESLRPLLERKTMWPVMGNHEGRCQPYFDNFVVPPDAVTMVGQEELYYATRWGPVWIGVLELIDFQLSWSADIDMPEVTWLKAALDSPEAQSARWRLLFVHEPPWNRGWGDCGPGHYQGDPGLQNVLLPLAEAKGVSAIFSGHVHGYEHGAVNGLQLFITGGAGGGLDHWCPDPPGLPQPWFSDYVHHYLRVDANCDALEVRAIDLDGNLIDDTSIPYGGGPVFSQHTDDVAEAPDDAGVDEVVPEIVEPVPDQDETDVADAAPQR
jgi:hypothetical protein